MPDFAQPEKDVSPKKTDAQRYEELPEEIKNLFEELGLTLDKRLSGCIQYKWDTNVIAQKLNERIDARERAKAATSNKEPLTSDEQQFLDSVEGAK
jgi:hypothetical protein